MAVVASLVLRTPTAGLTLWPYGGGSRLVGRSARSNLGTNRRIRPPPPTKRGRAQVSGASPAILAAPEGAPREIVTETKDPAGLAMNAWAARTRGLPVWFAFKEIIRGGWGRRAPYLRRGCVRGSDTSHRGADSRGGRATA